METNNIKNFSRAAYEFTAADEALVSRWTSEYPWFAYGQMVKALIEKNKQSQSYKAQLNQAALRAYDRELLFDFIYRRATASHEIKPLLNEEGREVKSKEELRAVVKRRLAEIDARKEQPEAKDAPQPEAGKQEDKAADEPPPPEVAAPQMEEAAEEQGPAEELEPIHYERITKADRDKSQRDKKDIIDDFIKKEPSVSRPEASSYEEIFKLAKESLEEHFDFVSETLAEIYLKQGNFDKAVKIYEQLIVKLPEKKLYFARRIKEIIDNK